MQNEQDKHRYDDLLNLPHPEPTTRPRMSAHDRAAQFSPFAALTGHSAAMEETARLTDQKIEPGEVALEELNTALGDIQLRLHEKPKVQITYFVPDARKNGGAYHTVTGRVRILDETAQIVELVDGLKIPIDDILRILPEDRKEQDAGT